MLANRVGHTEFSSSKSRLLTRYHTEHYYDWASCGGAVAAPGYPMPSVDSEVHNPAIRDASAEWLVPGSHKQSSQVQSLSGIFGSIHKLRL